MADERACYVVLLGRIWQNRPPTDLQSTSKYTLNPGFSAFFAEKFRTGFKNEGKSRFLLI
jgi:hypothetical protein